jgi:ribosomal protein S12 methylthiotransferase RimO
MTAPSVWLTTLGCAKNQVDSDKVSSLLDEAGYQQADSAESADVVMVNTCAFIEAARQESIDTIIEAGDAKRTDAKLVVMGCMAQRYETELAESLPEADAIVGLDRYSELVERIDHLTDWQPMRLVRPAMDILYEVRRPAPTTPYAYVKVAEGCDKPCTFCAIPLFRGKQRSRAPINIRDEIVQLVADGVTEVVLVAQDLGAYGRDLNAQGGIVELLQFLSDVDGLRQMRLLYLYPKEIRHQLIAEMASSEVVAPYFDLSLQHVVWPLLKAMKRSGDGDRHLDLIRQIRDAEPDSALRSSFIVGFPGETEDDVEALAAFLVEARLDWAGFFPYSAEEGTPAAELESQFPHDVKAERIRYLAQIQDDMTAEHNRAQVGRTLDVLVDMVEAGTPVGRSYRQAPEIDGVVILDRGRPGEWVQAEVTAAYEADLEARVV